MERQENKSTRTELDKKAGQCLREMRKAAKKGHYPVKIGLSQLASWVIVNFYKKHFKDEKENIRHEFLNCREWIGQGLKNTDDKELKRIFKKALKKASQDPKAKGKQKPVAFVTLQL